MRAREFILEEIIPSQRITLRSLHNIKNAERRQEQADAERRILMPIMYGHDDPRDDELAQRSLEMDRREIDLLKREAELDILDQHLRQSEKYHDAVQNMARHWIDKNDA